MVKIKELFRQKFGWKISHREIAKNLNMGVSTVTDYVDKARKAGITSWPLPEGMTEADLKLKLFGETPTEKQDATVDWEWVHKELKRKNVTRQLLWTELIEKTPTLMSYPQFCVHYARYKKTLDDPVMLQTHEPGEKFFVDYAGTTIPIIDPVTGEITAAYIFVGCVGVSSYAFVEATLSQELRNWIGSHIRMFLFWKGVPRFGILDNLKSGVKKAHRYDPDLNPTYQQFGQYYNFCSLPARPFRPKDKGKVESCVGYTSRQILAALRDMKFYSLGQLNEAIAKKLKILNDKPFQKMKTSRKILFEEIDKPELQPLPMTSYEYADYKKARIHVDYHFSYDDHLYSVPFKYCRQSVIIRATEKTVECFLDDERIAAHTRSYKKYSHTTLDAHMPKSHQEHKKCTLEAIMKQAAKIGPKTVLLLESIIKSKDYPEQAYRTCQGILRLEKPYGKDRLEMASSKALQIGMVRYDDISNMLKNKLESLPIETILKPPPINHNNIRGPQYYQ